MLDRLRDWLDSNPNGRKVLIAAGVAGLLMMLGVLIALNQDRPTDEPLPVVTVDASNLGENDPPLQDPGIEPDRPPPPPPGDGPRRPRTAWIREADVPAKAQPGLNLPAVKMLGQWEEVAHIQEDTDSHWDQVRLKDGQELWVQSKFVEFTKPANLDKPVPAELAVMAFYQAVARKDYAAGYSYLSSPWKAELSFDQFVDGYTRTLSLRTEIARVVELGEDRYQVDVSMIADELGRDVPYLGSYVVVKEGDQWDMASGRLLRQGPRDLTVPGPSDPGSAPPVVVPETPTLPPLPPTTPEVVETPGSGF